MPKYSKKHMKNLSVLPTPFPTIAIFFNVVANTLLKVSFICFKDAAHPNNDDEIKILNALIWESQDFLNNPRNNLNHRDEFMRGWLSYASQHYILLFVFCSFACACAYDRVIMQVRTSARACVVIRSISLLRGRWTLCQSGRRWGEGSTSRSTSPRRSNPAVNATRHCPRNTKVDQDGTRRS